MSKSMIVCAVDLGAESGRVIPVKFDGQTIKLEKPYRFTNAPKQIGDHFHWDARRLVDEIKQGLARCIGQTGVPQSVGCDSWGVDYGLLDDRGQLLGDPYCYRDVRTEGVLEKLFSIAPWPEVYTETGIQKHPINTLVQLFAAAQQESEVLDRADTLLLMADLVNYFLAGTTECEVTLASTSQMFKPKTSDWAWNMLNRLNIPTHFLPDIVSPGTAIGSLLPEVCDEIGASGRTISNVAVANHDTGSAYAIVSTQGRKPLVNSSGSWSLFGKILIDGPCVDQQSMEHNFTNESGVDGTFRFLRNIAGMWPLQQCRRVWREAGKDYSYDQLTQMAAEAEPFQHYLDVDHPSLGAVCDMPLRIIEFCQQTRQDPPQTRGEMVRMILEGLVYRYMDTQIALKTVLGETAGALHILGGGSQNGLLNQFTADGLGLNVLAGPVEATALGNAGIQLIALGEVTGYEEMRTVVQASAVPLVYTPDYSRKGQWEEAYKLYLEASMEAADIQLTA